MAWPSRETPDRVAKIGGNEVNCAPWPANGEPITKCKPQGYSGDVVIDVDGVKSAPRHLSRWQPTLHYHQEGPETFVVDIKMHLDFRGDVIKNREHPDEKDPTKDNAWVALSDDEQKVTCEVSISGSLAKECTSTGGGTFPYGTVPGGLCDVVIAYDPQNHPDMPFRFRPQVQVPGGTISCAGAGGVYPAQWLHMPGLDDDAGNAEFGAAVDPHTGQITARTKSYKEPGDAKAPTYTVSWEANDATPKNTDDDAR